jgi:uncharacterized RDD family membrane protein YckC
LDTNPYAAPREGGGPRGDDDSIDIPVTAGARFGAYLIESLIAGVLMMGALVGLAVLGFDLEDPAVSLASNFVSFATFWLYGTVFEASGWCATPGKRVLGLQVAKVGGGDPSMGDTILRNVVKWLGLSLCGLLAFSVLSKEGSSVWDGVAKTHVVRRVPVPR